ncbi:hypothetical protein VTL71DRAFT_2091 [Oculimacula yallundae]|uniref:Heterokaryon incompatibility domain-containing protein n=1 Tax=Oculimacula yallundae TaxID=86028 RepID=A0ABR4C7Y1_9HELO
MTHGMDIEQSSVWKSSDVVTQFQHELPMSMASNAVAFSIIRRNLTSTDGNIVYHKDGASQGQLRSRQGPKSGALSRRSEFIPRTYILNTSGNLYQQLSPGCFRILEVLPGPRKDSIRCHLHTALLEENKLAYDALSYTWAMDEYERRWSARGKTKKGDPSTEVFFACKGISVKVQENLHNVLRRIRDAQTSVYIWVDALCINQDDKVERGQQVRLMDAIYADAYQVLIWLGEPAGRGAYNVLASISRLVHIWAKEHGFEDMIPPSPFPIERQQFHNDTGGLLLGPSRREYTDSGLNLKRLGQFYGCKWFHRLWVLQEAALARSAKVLYGQYEISWDHVGIAASILRTNYDRLNDGLDSWDREEIPTGLLNAYFMYRISRSQNIFEPLRFSFHQLLRLTRQLGCSEGRDKIFGLLAIPTTDHAARDIVPDYESSEAEIYRKVASTLMKGSGSLDVLSSVQQDCGRDEPSLSEPDQVWPDQVWGSHNKWFRAGVSEPYDFEAPSWVPQWHIVYNQALGPLEPSTSFAASNGSLAVIRDSFDPCKLIVSGSLVDRVSVIRECKPDDFRQQWYTPGEWSLGDSRFANPALNLDTSTTTIKPFNKSDLVEIATTLTGGKNWYGLPIEDFDAHLADFAMCLVRGELRWALDEHVFVGTSEACRSEPLISLADLKNLSCNDGNGDRFLDAAVSACRERTCFRTAGWRRGLGPAAMKLGDVICVLFGAAMPYVIRREGGSWRLIGECFVDGLMRGEGVLGDEVGEERTWIELI